MVNGVQPSASLASPYASTPGSVVPANCGNRIAITREGLLQVDRLLHEFFKPEHQGPRYA